MTTLKLIGVKGKVLNGQARKIIYNVFKFMRDEAESNEVKIPLQNFRYECIFGREEADGWDVRQAMNDLTGYDSIPEPRIVIAGLNACRRLNDYAMAVRFLEMVKYKCGNEVDKVWPYIVQEVGPTVAKLGADFPEALGYDKPELYLESVFDM